MNSSYEAVPAPTLVKEAVVRIALIVASLSLLPLAAHAAEKGRPRSAVAKNDRGDKSDTRKADKPDKAAKAGAGQASAAPHATKPRVYDFSGLDVEGKLKTPQLLFFRSRVKQELDTSTPEKRSFMPELEKSADGKGL
jgi:hypothetical protein